MFFFFFNDTATTEIYTLSLHDALPISAAAAHPAARAPPPRSRTRRARTRRDRKSTRLNSSHVEISYAVFCLKKKKKKPKVPTLFDVPHRHQHKHDSRRHGRLNAEHNTH